MYGLFRFIKFVLFVKRLLLFGLVVLLLCTGTVVAVTGWPETPPPYTAVMLLGGLVCRFAVGRGGLRLLTECNCVVDDDRWADRFVACPDDVTEAPDDLLVPYLVLSLDLCVCIRVFLEVRKGVKLDFVSIELTSPMNTRNPDLRQDQNRCVRVKLSTRYCRGDLNSNQTVK